MVSQVKGGSYHSESLARGLMVIRAFDHKRPRLRAIDVADCIGISRAAARRFLLTLRDLGYVGSEDDVFFLQPRLLELGFSYLSSMGIEEIVQPTLDRISDQTEASSSYAVLDQFDVVFVARASTKGFFQIATHIGGRVAAHATSLGQVLLAGLSAKQLDYYLKNSKREAYTEKTVTSVAALRRKLDEVRAEGFALCCSERVEGIVAVAVPIFNRRKEVTGAININLYPANAGQVKNAKQHVEILRKEVHELEVAMQAHELNGQPRSGLG